jgi:hypothetical protein
MSFAAAMDDIEDRTFSELKVCDSPSIARTLTSQDIELVNAACGTKQEFCGRNAHYGTHH